MDFLKMESMYICKKCLIETMEYRKRYRDMKPS